ncbi:hypothetical protein M8J77_003284 [Diaphorina citri]|nr:hypothetical protein M8J77_003284 [Diaphorina citri]
MPRTIIGERRQRRNDERLTTCYLYVSSTKLLSFIFEIWDNPPLKAELEDFCCNLLITELLEKDIYWSKIGSDKWNAFLIFSISCRILIAAVSGLGSYSCKLIFIVWKNRWLWGRRHRWRQTLIQTISTYKRNIFIWSTKLTPQQII